MKNIEVSEAAHAARKKLVYTPKDLEGLLGLSKNSINALLRSGRIRSVRYGRKWLIPESAVEEFLR